MEVTVVTNEKEVVELDFSEKEVASALLPVLRDMGVDAYTYDPHPLKPGFRLHVESKDAMKDTKAALKKLDSQWKAFSKDLKKAL